MELIFHSVTFKKVVILIFTYLFLFLFINLGRPHFNRPAISTGSFKTYFSDPEAAMGVHSLHTTPLGICP